ncbi:MAG: PQQ-binding-like beta-propeller repeat protein [Bacteroidales bacterium]
MKKLFLILISVGSFLSFTISPLRSQETEWTRFRGSNGSGQAGEKASPPGVFGEIEKMKWKVKVPEGTSSPVIWKNRIYITGCIEEKNEMQLLCLDRTDGKILWTRSYFPEELEGAHPISNPAQSTPALDSEGVYLYDAAYGLICYHHDGNLHWKTPLSKVKHAWGHATSPVVMDDKVILNLDFGMDDSRNLIAINKNNGEIIWKTLTQKVSYFKDAVFLGYSTPVRLEDQILVHRIGGIASYSLEDGSPLWWMPVFTTGTSSPIVVDDVIYVALWNHFLAKSDKGEYFDYDDFNAAIADFDKDADHLLSVNEFPEDLLVASRIAVADYDGATHTVRRWFDFIDKDQNQEIDNQEWDEAYEYFNSYILDLGLIALRKENRGLFCFSSCSRESPVYCIAQGNSPYDKSHKNTRSYIRGQT